MDSIEEFVDERQKSWCIHCGGRITELETNFDHVPSKCFLQKPRPPNLPVIKICQPCNTKFSLDEEYFITFLHSVLVGSTDPDAHQNLKISRALKRNQKLRSRLEKTKTETKTLFGKTQLLWEPEIDRINRIVVKNARGHAFFEYGEPMSNDPEYVWALPLENLNAEKRVDFETIDMGAAWPEVGSRMITRVITGQDLVAGWVVVQEGVYRYSVTQSGAVLVKSVLFEYLATEVFWNN